MQFELTQIISMFALCGVAILMAVICGSVLNISPEQQGNRNKTLDGLRALAAVSVAASHINQYVCAYQGTNGVPHIGNHIGIIGVQMFFALTAYLFTERALKGKIQPIPFLAGRVRRIIPLYTFAVVAAIAIGFYYTRDVHAPLAQTAKEALKVYTYGFWNHHSLNFQGFNMLRLICVAWTLAYEWVFYLLLVPASKIWNKSRVAMGVVSLVILLLAWNQFSKQTEQVIWPFFIPGIVAAALSYYMPSPPAWLRKILPAAALTFFIMMVTLPGYWTAGKLALSLGLFLSVFYSEARFFSWKPLQTLATISFSIYLLQYLLICPVTLYINHHPAIFTSSVVKVAGAFLIMVALIPLSFVTYLTIEKPFITRRRPARLPAQKIAAGKRPVEDLVSSSR